MIEAGLFLSIGSRPRKRIGRSRRLNLRTSEEGAPLKEHLQTGFAYSIGRWTMPGSWCECYRCRERGASIRTRTRCVPPRGKQAYGRQHASPAKRNDDECDARALVNAAGPGLARNCSKFSPAFRSFVVFVFHNLSRLLRTQERVTMQRKMEATPQPGIPKARRLGKPRSNLPEQRIVGKKKRRRSQPKGR